MTSGISPNWNTPNVYPAYTNHAVPANIPVYKTTDSLTPSCKVFRLITLALQITAMLAYYLPTLINGGNFGIIWLAIGVVQTVVFCAIFFRDSRTRTGISIALMVIATIWNLIMLIAVGLLAIIVAELGLSVSTGVTYALCSLIAVIFALCFPRKYKIILAEHADEPIPAITPATEPIPR